MQFLGIGYQEMLVVLVLLLVVVGPQRLPEVAYQLGRAVRTMQSYARAVRSEFGEEITYIEEQYKTVKGEVETTRQSFREQQAQFASEMRDVTAPLQQELNTLAQAPSNIVNFSAPAAGASPGSVSAPNAPAAPAIEIVPPAAALVAPAVAAAAPAPDPAPAANPASAKPPLVF